MKAIAGLYPGYFSLVMATGIVSIAALFEGWPVVAWALFAINGVAYAVLWVLTLIRLFRWPRRLFGDMVDHRRGPGFFTLVAGSAVLGNQFVLLADQPTVAMMLLVLAALLWVVITYTFFVAVIVRTPKAGVAEALSGGWLLAAVGTQSLAVLATLVAPYVPDPSIILLIATVLWLLGGMQYLLIIGPIFHRLVFLDLTPGTWTPLFWINSGALAITTLAGLTSGSQRVDVHVPRRRAAIREGVHAVLLGGRHLVDPAAGAHRCVAARGSTLSAGVRAGVLGSGLPAWHVYGVHVPTHAGDRAHSTECDSTRDGLRCAAGLGCNVRGAACAT